MAFYRVRQKLMETCYVERDVLVEAATPEEAKQKAIDNDTLDTGEDHCCEVDHCDDYGIAYDGAGDDYEPELDEDWGKRHAAYKARYGG